MNLNVTNLAPFVELGEHAFVEKVVRETVNDNMRLIPLPRSIYELAALTLHGFDRLETAFDLIDFSSPDTSFVPPFSFDHKTTLHRVTPELLIKASRASLESQSLIKVANNVNTILACCMIHMHLFGDSIQSIMDLDIGNSSFKGEQTHLEAAFAINLKKMAKIFLSDLALFESGSGSEISLKCDQWPLSSPYFTDLEGEDTALVQKTVQKILDDLARLSSLISSVELSPQSLSKTQDLLTDIQMRRFGDGEEAQIYGKILDALCPGLSTSDMVLYDGIKDFDTGENGIRQCGISRRKFVEIKRFLAQLDPFRLRDPFIAYIRKNGFFSKRTDLIMKTIEAEIDVQNLKNFDLAFLYRGTRAMSHESLSTNRKEFLSFEQYGLELGCSTDYGGDLNFSASSNPCDAHSMSFGSSLFAGMLYDPTASAWTYWASEQTEFGFFLKVPIDESLLNRIRRDLCNVRSKEENDKIGFVTNDTCSDWRDWIFFPPIPSLVSLGGTGELWHARTKCYISKEHEDDTFAFITGMLNCSYKRVPSFLRMTSITVKSGSNDGKHPMKFENGDINSEHQDGKVTQGPPAFKTLPIVIVKSPPQETSGTS